MRVSGQDLRLAARTLAKHRGFTTVAVLSLALAIALNTTMYGVIDALVNPKLAMAAPERLYGLAFFGNYRRLLPAGAIEDALRSGLHGYEGITGSRPFALGSVGATIERGRRFHEGRVVTVRPDFFSVLGVRARRGRVFGPADLTVGAPAAVIGERLADKLFPDGADPVGQSIDIDGQTFGVLGVLPKGSDFCGSCTDAWVLPPPDQVRSIPLNIMRVRANTPIPAVENELRVLSLRLSMAGGEGPDETRFRLRPAVHGQFEFHRFQYALIAAVVAVLLVACFNLANMQLARGIGRARELALRVALGASRFELILQMLIESGLLAAAGLGIGLLLTVWASSLLGASIPERVGSYIVEPQISWRVLVFAAITSVVCLLIVGLVPAIRVSRVDPNDLLKSGAGTGAHKRNQRRYGVLIVAQIGLALALLSGAAIVVRQALRVDSVRLGFDPKPLATAWRFFARPPVGPATFPSTASEVLARVRGVPDIAEAAAYSGAGPDARAVTITDPGGGVVEFPAGFWNYRIVSPSYLKTMKLPIVAGRDFLEGERDIPAAIIDRKTARYLWPNSVPVGAMIKLGEFKSRRPWVRVVGVVGEEIDYSRLDRSLRPDLSTMGLGQVYVLGTAADTLWGSKTVVSINVIARARSNPERLPGALRLALIGMPGNVAVRSRSMESSMGYAARRANHDFVAAIFSAFAALALALSALGVYGIVNHSVAERRREIGVRIALGAGTRSILSAVLREGNLLALSGVAVGLLLTKYTAGWLYAFSLEDDQYDAPLFAAMAVVLFAVTVIAAFIPALRATRIDPVEALRSE